MQNATALILAQAIELAEVMALSASGPQASYTAKLRCPGSYTEL